MVKWGRRLLGRAKGPSHGKKDVRRGAMPNKFYYDEQRREYDDYSEGSLYDNSYDAKRYYEETAGWGDRDDDDVVQDEYCDKSLEEYEGDEFRDDDRDSDDELVTRDQVLDELKAQAAAEALGKSLEQMGYNLDNCDSFYSLSEKEEIDQRYKIAQRENSEVSIALKSGGSPAKKIKKRQSKGKRKKKRNKSSRSRYSAASDDDESSTYYGTHSSIRGARHHSFGDHGTRGNSSSDASDSSYYEDETLTYTTGGASALTGKTSRFSRYTGKKSARSRKSKLMKQKKCSQDQDTYYSRRSEWTHGDSSYGKSLDHSSTLSSVSSSEESDLDLNTEYTERSRKGDRTRKKESSGHAQKVEKKRRHVTPIDEEKSELIVLECSSSGRKKKPEKRQVRNPQVLRRSLSLMSNSSQIGALRSFDSFSCKGSAVDGKEEEKEQNAEERKTQKGNDTKKSTKKEISIPEEIKKNADNQKSPKSCAKQLSKKDTKEGIVGVKVEAMDHVLEARENRKATRSKSGKGKAPKAQESGEITAGGRSGRKGKGKEVSTINSRDHYKSGFQDDEDTMTLDSDRGMACKAQESSCTAVGDRKGKGRSSRDSYKSGHRDDEDTTTSDLDGIYREMKTTSKQNKGYASDNSFGPRRSRVRSDMRGAKASKDQEPSEKDGTRAKKKEDKVTPEPTRESSPARNQTPMAMLNDTPVPASGARKFWRRQFLSLGRKKTNDKRCQKEEGEGEEERESDVQQDVMGEDQSDIDRKADHKKGGKHEGAAKSSRKASRDSPFQERKAGHERSFERERSDSPDKRLLKEQSPSHASRGRSPSSTKSEKGLSLPRDGRKKERSKSSDSKRKRSAAKETGITEKEATQAAGHLDKPGNTSTLKTEEEDEEKENQPQSSSGSISMFGLAAMAAMVPLAPLAAAYTCYTADRTQSFLTNGTACIDHTCKDMEAQSMECAKMDDMEVVEEKDDKDHTRSSRKRRHKPAQKENPINQRDEDQGSLKSLAGSKRSSRLAQFVERMDGEAMPISKALRSPKAHACRSKSDDAKMPKSNSTGGSRSKKSLTKILPHCGSKHDALKAYIQEAPEGFESFLPSAGTLETQCLSISDTTTFTSQALSTIPVTPGRGLTVHSGLQQNCDTARKKSKRWLSKLPFGSNRRTDEKSNTNGLAEAVAVNQMHQVAVNNTSRPRAPPVMSMASKKAAANGENNMSSTKALSSFWAEKPSFSAKASNRKPKMESKKNQLSPDGEIIPFSCSGKSSAVCGQVDEGEGSLLEDQSLLSEFENIAMEALRKKSQAQVKNLGPGFDQTQATHEDLLKYYDLGQTLSDVIDARQTLEHAYGMHSGGNSFDHTVDDQLVELLTHMAEMDQDDVVEIESAIKKLKRHARKLGISERDLLFSVKSAEESALSITGEESFSSKMIDAIEGYFGGPNRSQGAHF